MESSPIAYPHAIKFPRSPHCETLQCMPPMYRRSLPSPRYTVILGYLAEGFNQTRSLDACAGQMLTSHGSKYTEN